MKKHTGMRPQDIAVLLKIIALGGQPWQGKQLAESLFISPSEVSESLQRSQFAGLLDVGKKGVHRQAFFDFLIHGFRFVFPVRPGHLTRGIPTAHSAEPLASLVKSVEPVVWPFAEGTVRGQAVEPIYPNVVLAASKDPLLHELLALVDALRIGRARERELALKALKTKFFANEQS